jgi:hypothetical protein
MLYKAVKPSTSLFLLHHTPSLPIQVEKKIEGVEE